MKVYKMTDKNMRTHNSCEWELNVPKKATGIGLKLCSDDVIHFYHHPLIAVLFNPIYGDFRNPRLFEAEAEGEIVNDRYTKGGCKQLTLTKEIEVPTMSMNQHIACGILFAKKVYKDKDWNTWADNWLNGTDRTEKSAADTAADAYSAAYYAAYSAAYSAADSAAYSAAYSADAAYAVLSSLEDTETLDEILTTINKAMEY